MNDPIQSPSRRTSWAVHRVVDNLLEMLDNGLPRHEAQECFESLGVCSDRITELLNGERRTC